MELIIVSIFFFTGLLGTFVILLKKIPILVELPKNPPANFLENFVLNFRKQIINLSFFKNFSVELYLQKILSRVKVVVLKIENMINHWLRTLRQKSIEKNNHKPDNYWKELKKAKVKNTKKRS